MLYKSKMHFFRDSGISNVLESSCINYTLRLLAPSMGLARWASRWLFKIVPDDFVCARCFLALTKKSQFLAVSLGENFNKPNKFEEANGGK